MSETPAGVPGQTAPEPPKRRSRTSKLVELLFWIALALLVAWILIQNVDSILPANSF